MKYDVNIMLTTEAEDTKDQVLYGPLSSIGFSPTFKRIQEVAVQYNGSWADWEPYRCTYVIEGLENAKQFIRAIYKEFPSQINLTANKT